MEFEVSSTGPNSILFPKSRTWELLRFTVLVRLFRSVRPAFLATWRKLLIASTRVKSAGQRPGGHDSRRFAPRPEPQRRAVLALGRGDNVLRTGRFGVAEQQNVEAPRVEFTEHRYRIVSDLTRSCYREAAEHVGPVPTQQAHQATQ